MVFILFYMALYDFILFLYDFRSVLYDFIWFDTLFILIMVYCNDTCAWNPNFSFQAGWAGRQGHAVAGRQGRNTVHGWPPDGPRMAGTAGLI